MLLEARREHCFSTVHVLKLDGRAVGRFQGRFWSEGIDVELLGHRRWRFVRPGWFGSEFLLQEADSDTVLARAAQAGMFTSTWDLELSIGSAKLVHAGWFQSGYRIVQGDQEHGFVDRLGPCESGWTARNTGALSETDLLVAGLLYQIIVQRQAAAASAAAAGS